MPGSEFRLLPLLPVEFNKYRVIMPWKLGRAMSDGWMPVAALNFKRVIQRDDEAPVVVDETRYLVGNDPKEEIIVPVAHRAPLGIPELRGGAVGPELSYPQPVDDLEPPPEQLEAPPQSEPPPEQVEAVAAPAPSPEEEDADVAQVKKDMDELLGDDGSQDDDE